jgi:hypothetical protein
MAEYEDSPPKPVAQQSDVPESWSLLEGREVEILRDGRVVDRGVVDAVTSDGSILWLRQQGAVQRRLVERTADCRLRIRHTD